MIARGRERDAQTACESLVVVVDHGGDGVCGASRWSQAQGRTSRSQHPSQSTHTPHQARTTKLARQRDSAKRAASLEIEKKKVSVLPSLLLGLHRPLSPRGHRQSPPRDARSFARPSSGARRSSRAGSIGTPSRKPSRRRLTPALLLPPHHHHHPLSQPPPPHPQQPASDPRDRARAGQRERDVAPPRGRLARAPRRKRRRRRRAVARRHDPRQAQGQGRVFRQGRHLWPVRGPGHLGRLRRLRPAVPGGGASARGAFFVGIA